MASTKSDKTELIDDLKAMSLEISSICGANQGLQSDSGFIDENRNSGGTATDSETDSEKEIISDISSMLTEMNEILDRMTSSGVKMRANDDSYFEAATSFPQNQTLKVDESMGRSGLRSHDISEQMIELESLTTECGCQQILEKCKIS